MATKRTTKKKGAGAAPAAAAAAVAAAAAGAATYYFYGTKSAKKHRQAASKWAKGLQKDVQKGVRSLRKVDAKTVARVIDDAAAAYQGVRGVAANDVRAATKELKSNWTRIQKELTPSGAVRRAVKKAVSTAKKSVKKTPKKTAKKKKTAKRK